MAELGFMESLALGYMAAGSGPRLSEAGVGILHDLHHKQAVANADAAYAALVAEYNLVVDRHDTVVERFWKVHGWYESWRAYGEKYKAKADQLQADLNAANERMAAWEAHAQSLAQQIARATQSADFYKERYQSVCEMGTEDARALREANEENERLKAIIKSAGLSGA